MWQTIIHALFILSAIGIANVDRLSQGAVPHPAKAHKGGHRRQRSLEGLFAIVSSRADRNYCGR